MRPRLSHFKGQPSHLASNLKVLIRRSLIPASSLGRHIIYVTQYSQTAAKSHHFRLSERPGRQPMLVTREPEAARKLLLTPRHLLFQLWSADDVMGDLPDLSSKQDSCEFYMCHLYSFTFFLATNPTGLFSAMGVASSPHTQKSWTIKSSREKCS